MRIILKYNLTLHKVDDEIKIGIEECFCELEKKRDFEGINIIFEEEGLKLKVFPKGKNFNVECFNSKVDFYEEEFEKEIETKKKESNYFEAKFNDKENFEIANLFLFFKIDKNHDDFYFLEKELIK